MTARRLLNIVHTMLLEAHGEDEVNEMLHPQTAPTHDRTAALIALGGEVVNA